MRFIVLFAMIGLLAAGGSAMSRREVAGVAAPTGQGSPVASCASAGCHGGGEVGRVGSEQSTWAAGDPHAKAYSVLFNETSQRIMANLRRSDDKRPVDASKDGSCLACHGPNHESPSDGVGCDACHGESKKWIARHYEPGWKSLSDTEKMNLNFKNTKDLVTRIGECASCHVGDFTRSVTHDFIAAGHPRLAFEYTRFHYQTGYHKHWKESTQQRDFEIRSWFIGQVVALEKAVDRTEHTEIDMNIHGGSKELSDQSCFACHHNLKGNGGISTNAWQPWNTAMVGVLAEMTPIIFPGAQQPGLRAFDEFAKSYGDPAKKADDLHRHDRVDRTMRTKRDLEAWFYDLGWYGAPERASVISDADLRQLALKVAESAVKAPADWDVLAPHYLALAAVFHADGKTLADIAEPLEKLKDLIKYPAGYNSPAGFDAEKTREQFAIIAKILTPGAAP